MLQLADESPVRDCIEDLAKIRHSYVDLFPVVKVLIMLWEVMRNHDSQECLLQKLWFTGTRIPWTSR